MILFLMSKTFLLFFLIVGSLIHAQTDFLNANLRLKLDTITEEVYGNAKFSLVQSGPELYVNAVNFDILYVGLNNKKASYNYTNDTLHITTKPTTYNGDTSYLEIEYRAKPRKGIFFNGWNVEGAKKQIWTQGQGIDHRHWIPFKDDQRDKLITELSIGFNSKYQVLSNGKLLEKSTLGETTYWHYRISKPQSSYLLMLAIGEYELTTEKSKSNFALDNYIYPSTLDLYPTTFYQNQGIFDFMEAEIGRKFPWEVYRQVPVIDFQHGAMENTTATIFGDFFITDTNAFNDRNYTYVNAHELAHQWFGNYVTAEDSRSHWLHEGFATYYQWLSERNIYGEDKFDSERYLASQRIFSATKTSKKSLSSPDAGSYRFYDKGAYLVFMISNELGRENYRNAIHEYLDSNAYSVVNSETLLYYLKKYGNEGFEDFYNYWLNHKEEPNLSAKLKFKGKRLNVLLEVAPESLGSYSLQIPVKIFFENGSEEVIYLDAINLEHRLEFEEDIYRVNFNPNMSLLLNQKLEMSIENIQRTLSDDNKILNRLMAVQSARNISSKKTSSLLENTLKNEKEHYLVRVEAFNGVKKSLSLKDYISLLESEDINFLKEIIGDLPEEFRAALRTSLLSLLDLHSYELQAMVVQLAVDFRNPSSNEWLNNFEFTEDNSFGNYKVEINVLLMKTALYQDENALNQLKDFTDPKYSFMIRQNAISALSALNYFDKDLCANYIQAVLHFNRPLRNSARKELKKLYQNQESKTLIDEYIRLNKSQWDDYQNRLIANTFK